jgi:hypothetical protein
MPGMPWRSPKRSSRHWQCRRRDPSYPPAVWLSQPGSSFGLLVGVMREHTSRGCKRTFRSVGSHRYAPLFRCADANRAWPPCRIAGCRVLAIGQPRIVGRGNICSSFRHSSDIRGACLPRHLYAQHHAFVIGPRGLWNRTRYRRLRARALRWLFDHGNACQLSSCVVLSYCNAYSLQVVDENHPASL